MHDDVEALAARYLQVRAVTEKLCEGLAAEDFVIQAMPDASPTKWHLAHVSWFFETFLLKPFLAGYQPLDARYEYLFNSYYNAVGPQFSRANRGDLSRPTVAEVFEYRAHVDHGMAMLFDSSGGADVVDRVELGIQHEQQHQELLLTDIKYNLSVNPLRPVYKNRGAGDGDAAAGGSAPAMRWVPFEGGLVPIGHDGQGFAFDNEGPRHEMLLRPFSLASRPVTNAEFMEFIDDGGYQRPELWLSAGWPSTQEWGAPLYWERGEDGWQTFTLGGMAPIDPGAPVSHVSYYEADAFAHWTGKRLPTEQEWEHAASTQPIAGNFQESRALQPRAAANGTGLTQMFGDVWEWTGSAYLPYPGFRTLEGALGEYNGKFMVNQMVLRGGSCVTPESHIRASYRNFFPAEARWQFMGLRLASDS